MVGTPELVLVMGRDLELRDGKLELGPESIRLVDTAIAYVSGKPQAVPCFAACQSPYHGENTPTLGELMERYFMDRVEHVCLLLEAYDFDSRGEVCAMWQYFLQRGLQQYRKVTVITADVQIKRLRTIVRQECGRIGLAHIEFIPVTSPFTFLGLAKEWLKRYVHVYLPPGLGRSLVHLLRSAGLNTSY